MIGVFKTKPAIIVSILVSLPAIVFVAKAFFTPEAADSKPIRDYVVSLNRNDFDSYMDTTYGFSLSLPKGFIVSSSPQDEGEVIIAELPNLNLGLEVFIAPFDAEGPLTVDTIRESQSFSYH